MVDSNHAQRHLERIMYVADCSLLLRDTPKQKELALEIIRNITDAYFRQDKSPGNERVYTDSRPAPEDT